MKEIHGKYPGVIERTEKIYQGTSDLMPPDGLASGLLMSFSPFAPKILGNPAGFPVAFVTTDEKSAAQSEYQI